MYKTDELIKGIEKLADGIGEVYIMEVCGTHTASIRRFGIESILPPNIKMVSGPGCPVCVTSQEDILKALSIADRDDVIFTCFGDMMRVPCGKESLYNLYENGRDVRLVTSPMDSLRIATENPDKNVVYFGIGFETTAPHTAALVEKAESMNIENLSILNSHKTMPQAILQLLAGQDKINALLCPGHVASIIGSDKFSFVPEILHLPAAIAGFEAYDILAAILCIMKMIRTQKLACVNMYPAAVTSEGNTSAVDLMNKVFMPGDAVWRGLGKISGSGLCFRDNFKKYNALCRYDVQSIIPHEPQGCLCSKILRGEKIPTECAYFAKRCTPDNPVGPCMVSIEGSCSAYYNYSEE